MVFHILPESPRAAAHPRGHGPPEIATRAAGAKAARIPRASKPHRINRRVKSIFPASSGGGVAYDRDSAFPLRTTGYLRIPRAERGPPSCARRVLYFPNPGGGRGNAMDGGAILPAEAGGNSDKKMAGRPRAATTE